MVSLMQWTWTWASSGRWWGTGSPSVLQSMGLQRVGHNWATEHNNNKGVQLPCVSAVTYLNIHLPLSFVPCPRNDQFCFRVSEAKKEAVFWVVLPQMLSAQHPIQLGMFYQTYAGITVGHGSSPPHIRWDSQNGASLPCFCGKHLCCRILQCSSEVQLSCVYTTVGKLGVIEDKACPAFCHHLWLEKYLNTAGPDQNSSP